MTHKLQGLLVLLSACALVASASAGTFYVNSSTGSLSHAGTAPSIPFKTLAQVNQRQADGTIRSGDTVVFACGSVLSTVAQPLKLKTGVSYVAEPGCAERPRLTGAVLLTGLDWQNHSGNIYWASVPAQVSVSGIDVAVSSIYQLVDETSASPSKRLQRARHPNPGDGSYASVDMAGKPNSRYFRIGKDTPASSPGTWVLDLARGTWRSSLQPDVTAEHYVGAEVFVRQFDWLMSRFRITDLPEGELVTLGWTDLYGAQSADQFDGQRANPNNDLAGGYWLENKLWMLDAPGEWYFDPASRRLYVYRQDGQTPSNNTTYHAVVGAYGIVGGMEGGRVEQYATDPQGPSVEQDVVIADNFVIRGLDIEDVALDGISIYGQSTDQPIPVVMPSTLTPLIGNRTLASYLKSMRIENVAVSRAGRSGIVVRAVYGDLDGAQTVPPQIIDSTITDADHFGISVTLGSERGTVTTPFFWPSSGVLIARNKVLRSGLYGDGAQVAGISAPGVRNTIVDNVVDSSGFRGIEFGPKALVERNHVKNSCLVLDDCGALYVIGAGGASSRPPTPEDVAAAFTDATVRANVIAGVPGTQDGRHSPSSMAHGIYLDYIVDKARIEGNTISGFRATGILLGASANVQIHGNTLVASLPDSVALTIERVDNVAASGNIVSNNQVLATSPYAFLVQHTSDIRPGGSYLEGFATYTGNRYGSRTLPAYLVRTPDDVQPGGTISRALYWDQWLAQGSDFAADGVVGNAKASLYFKDRVTLSEVILANGSMNDQKLTPWSGLGGTVLTFFPWTDPNCRGLLGGGCMEVRPVLPGDWYPRKVGFLRHPALGFGAAGAVSGNQYRLYFHAKSMSSNPDEVGEMVRPLLLKSDESFLFNNRERFVYIDKNWREYYVNFDIASSATTGKLDFAIYSNDRVRMDQVRFFKATPMPNVDNDFHVVVNSSGASIYAPCPRLNAGQKYSDFKDLSNQGVSFVCNGTTVAPMSSRVFVMTK